MAKKKKINKQLESLAIRATQAIGTPISIVIHTIIFALFTLALWTGLDFDKTLLVWNTSVSLEAIYLALFIQLTVNKNTESLEDVGEDIEEIQEDVEGLDKDFDEIQEDVEGLEGNINKMRRNMKDLEEDIEDISEDVDKLSEEEKSEEELIHVQSNKSLKNIEKEILTLSTGILALKDDLEILKKTIK
jgi:peptidoglycan hydrolase CwlO-like protein